MTRSPAIVFALSLLLALTVLHPFCHAAGWAGVPPSLQAKLLARLLPYDTGFISRAAGRVRMVLLVKSGHAESEYVATEMRSALALIDDIGGLQHEERIVAFTSGVQLAELCRRQMISVVYLAPGLEDELRPLARDLEGLSVLTVSAVPGYVVRGVVLGFELEEGRPQLVLNVMQAKRQHVSFADGVLRLFRMVR